MHSKFVKNRQKNLRSVSLRGNPLDQLELSSSWNNVRITTSSTQQCCLAPGFPSCQPKDINLISACSDMFGHVSIRVFMLIIVCLCLIGNVFAFVWWVRNKSEAHVSIQRQVLCLTIADFLIALFFISILGKDAALAGIYGKHQADWRGSKSCKVLAAFIFFCYEISVFMQMVIPLDRAILLGFSRRNKGLGRLTNLTTIAAGLLVSIIFSALYMVFVGFGLEEKVPNDLCIPFIGFGASGKMWQFLGIVFVLLNINFFLGAGVCYAFILDKAFKSMNEAMANSNDVEVQRYQRGQKRALVLKTCLGFFCHIFAWLFISCSEVLYLVQGTDMSLVLYSLLSFGFLLIGPLINPVLYTFFTGDFRQRVIVKVKLSIRRSIRKARGLAEPIDTNGHTVYADDTLSLSEQPAYTEELQPSSIRRTEAVTHFTEAASVSAVEMTDVSTNDRSGIIQHSTNYL